MLWAGGAAAFLIILGLIVIGFQVLPGLFGGEEDPTVTPTPAAAIATPTTTVPTTTMPTPNTTPQPTFSVQVSLDVPTDTVRVGESLTVTVTVTNTGGIAASNLRYELVGEWAPYLELTTPKAVKHEGEVAPQASQAKIFELQAKQAGEATLQGHLLMDVEGVTESRSSDIVKVTISQ
jgi:hypothetical protein